MKEVIKCDGVHSDLDSLFSCEDCKELFKCEECGETMPCQEHCGHERFSSDVMDYGDDGTGDGYVAYAFIVCDICGKSAKVAEDLWES